MCKVLPLQSHLSWLNATIITPNYCSASVVTCNFLELINIFVYLKSTVYSYNEARNIAKSTLFQMN